MENARYYLDLARRVSRSTDTRPSSKRYIRTPRIDFVSITRR